MTKNEQLYNRYLLNSTRTPITKSTKIAMAIDISCRGKNETAKSFIFRSKLKSLFRLNTKYRTAPISNRKKSIFKIPQIEKSPLSLSDKNRRRCSG
jgi:hypothetical protein